MTYRNAYLISLGLALLGFFTGHWIFLATATILNAMIGFFKSLRDDD